MSVVPLKMYPDPILRKPSVLVKIFESHEIHTLINDMGQTMISNDGIGLAAPQIGKNIQLFIIKTKDGIEAWLNPEIIKKSRKKEFGEEGCLSIPKVFGNVKRHIDIEVRAYDITGKQVIFSAHGLYARVIQHEIDHINGILFIDRVKKITHGKDILRSYESKR